MLKKRRTPNDFELSSQLYFKDISKYSTLSLDEELSLWKKYKLNNDITARDTLINSNLRFVANVAKGCQGLGLSYSDLIAEGNMGLLRSFEKFDYKKGYKTISYSVWWIRQAILEALKERAGIEGEELPSEYEKQSFEDEDEIKTETPISTCFIDDYVNDEAKYTELKNIIEVLSTCLTKRELLVIKDYFGIDGDALTLEEIGEKMGLTKERIRQIKKKAINKLRAECLLNSITSDIYK